MIPFAASIAPVAPMAPALSRSRPRPKTTEPVAVRKRIAAEDLIALAEGRIRAIHVPNFYPSAFAGIVAQRLIKSPLFGKYANAPDIGRVGMAYFETIKNPALRKKYYADAPAWIQALRDVASPFQSPMDSLRLQLQERWPSGANLEMVDGQPMFVGLARVFESGAGAHPHQDILRRDADLGNDRAASLITQFGTNVYLRPSAEGGELELWGTRPNDAEFTGMCMPGSYGADRSKMVDPDVVLRPKAGDAIIFDATRLHAVRPAVGGPRVTVSCFIGYRGPEKPLTFWS